MRYRRFRHFGKGKITLNFSFFEIAFSIKKLCKTTLNVNLKHLK